jgi:small nuclear ribonucleoprotein
MSEGLAFAVAGGQLMPEDMATRLLEESLGKIVLVKLKGGRSIRGKLQGFDQHMNLLLGEAEDVSSADRADRLGTIIVRGDNVILISPPKTSSI